MTFASVPIPFEPQNGHAAGRGSASERECCMDRKLPFFKMTATTGRGCVVAGDARHAHRHRLRGESVGAHRHVGVGASATSSAATARVAPSTPVGSASVLPRSTGQNDRPRVSDRCHSDVHPCRDPRYSGIGVLRLAVIGREPVTVGRAPHIPNGHIAGAERSDRRRASSCRALRAAALRARGGVAPIGRGRAPSVDIRRLDSIFLPRKLRPRACCNGWARQNAPGPSS